MVLGIEFHGGLEVSIELDFDVFDFQSGDLDQGQKGNAHGEGGSWGSVLAFGIVEDQVLDNGSVLGIGGEGHSLDESNGGSGGLGLSLDGSIKRSTNEVGELEVAQLFNEGEGANNEGQKNQNALHVIPLKCQNLNKQFK